MSPLLSNEKAGAAPTATGPLDTEFVHPVSLDSLKVGLPPEKSIMVGEPIAESPAVLALRVENGSAFADEASPCVIAKLSSSEQVLPTEWANGDVVLPVSLHPRNSDESFSDWSEWLRSNLRVSVRWDEFILTDVIKHNGEWVILDKVEVSALLNECKDLGCPRISFKDFEQYLRVRARRNKFDSAKVWLAKLPKWDGTKRIERFLPDYLGTGSSPYFEAVGRYLWTAMYARLAEPGCKVDMVPVIVGGQGLGKTRLLNLIAPEPLYYSSACLTDPTHQLVRKTLGKSLIGWEELAGIKGRVDADKVKTFITNHFDELSNSIKGSADRHYRRFVVFGTSNRKEFLRDVTGHRRYLPFEAMWINLAKVEEDKLQLWAEARAMVLERKSLGLSLVDYQDAERLAAAEYEEFTRKASWYGDPSLHAFLGGGRDKFRTDDALVSVGLHAGFIRHSDRIEMGDTLRQLGYRYGKDRNVIPGKMTWVWHKPKSQGAIPIQPLGGASTLRPSSQFSSPYP